MDESVKENYEQCAKCLTTTVIWTTQTVNRYYAALHMLVLVGILMAFSIIGGYVFQQIEATHEKTNAEAILTKRGTVIDSATNKKDGASQEKSSELTILQYEGNFIKAIQNGVVLVDGEAQTLWSFGGSVYFCMTTYTLLGYGNLAPKSNLGRVIAIVYSGFCIPIATLIIGDIGEIFLQMFEFTWRLIARWNYRRALRKEKDKAGNNIYSQKIRSGRLEGRPSTVQIDTMIPLENLQLCNEANERNLRSQCYENREIVKMKTFHEGTLSKRILNLRTGRQESTRQGLDCGFHILCETVLLLAGAALTVISSLFKKFVIIRACRRWLQTSIDKSKKSSFHSRSLTRKSVENIPHTFVNWPLGGTNGEFHNEDRKDTIRVVSEGNIDNVADMRTCTDEFEFSKSCQTVYIKDIYASNNILTQTHYSLAEASHGDACSENICDGVPQKIHHGINRNTSRALKYRKGLDPLPPAREFLRTHLSRYVLASPWKWFFVIKMIRDRISAHSKHRPCLRGARGENKNNNADLWEDPTMVDYAFFGIDDTSKAAPEHADAPQSTVPILMTTIMGFVYISGGSIALSLMSDQLSFFDCFWFMFISTLTVGYGDVVPADQELMIFFLLYIFICLSLMSNVINEISQFFNANVAKLRDIGHDAVGIIKAKKEIEIKKEKSSQARKHWKIVRDRVKKGKIPRRLILESRMYKAKLLAEEREQVRWAFKIYFEYLCSLKQQGIAQEAHIEEPAPEPPEEEPPVEEPSTPSEGSVTPEDFDLEEEASMKEIDIVPSEVPEPEVSEILIITQPEEDAEKDKKLTRWQRFKRYVKRVSKKTYEKTKTFTKKAIEKIKNSKLMKLFKRKKPDAEEITEEAKPKKKPFYFV